MCDVDEETRMQTTCPLEELEDTKTDAEGRPYRVLSAQCICGRVMGRVAQDADMFTCPDCHHTMKIEPTSEFKPSNPKDAVGVRKVTTFCISTPVEMELGLAMMEGGRKYGVFNYRAIGVLGSVYYDAARRHMSAWKEGEDIDPHSGIHHITKAMASLVVMRDAMIFGSFTDDRPPPAPEGWMEDMNAKASALIDRYPDRAEPFTRERCERDGKCKEEQE